MGIQKWMMLLCSMATGLAAQMTFQAAMDGDMSFFAAATVATATLLITTITWFRTDSNSDQS